MAGFCLRARNAAGRTMTMVVDGYEDTDQAADRAAALRAFCVETGWTVTALTVAPLRSQLSINGADPTPGGEG